MNRRVTSILKGCERNSGASRAAIAELNASTNGRLPESYREFLVETNGIEGFVGEEAYLILWPAEEVGPLNEAYAVNEFAPGIILLGTDGGNTGYGIDTRAECAPFIEVPLMGMALDVVAVLGDTLEDFLEQLHAAE